MDGCGGPDTVDGTVVRLPMWKSRIIVQARMMVMEDGFEVEARELDRTRGPRREALLLLQKEKMAPLVMSEEEIRHQMLLIGGRR